MKPKLYGNPRSYVLFFVQMVELLVAAEIELMAYQTVVQMSDHQFRMIDQGKDPGLYTALNEMIADPIRRTAAEQRFVKISQLRKGLTEQNLNLALSGIKDVIARKTGQPMPG